MVQRGNMLQGLQECNVQGADQEYALGFPVRGKERCLEIQAFMIDMIRKALYFVFSHREGPLPSLPFRVSLSLTGGF